ncbi:MAG: type II toxin-antitoxin system HicB family antitoxin [Thermodesulfobacteriota bacterium]
MKSYSFKAIIEEDFFEDGPTAYRAYVPILEEKGASTWGKTKEEAIRNIQEVVGMIIDSMKEAGEPIPENPKDDVIVFNEPRVNIVI